VGRQFSRRRCGRSELLRRYPGHPASRRRTRQAGHRDRGRLR